MNRVDLNIDLGELPDEPTELYALATVVNIACGGHAGDEASMERAVSSAQRSGARLAAHPSYPDRAGFGRTSMAITPDDLARTVEEQCAALQAIARRHGRPVAMVKPHGALYHDAARDPAMAQAVIEGAARGLGVDATALTMVGPPRGALLEAAGAHGASYAREAFADRGYRPDGSLVPRSEANALLTDPEACARQALSLVDAGGFETMCLHGDTPNAVGIATRVRDALAKARSLAGT